MMFLARWKLGAPARLQQRPGLRLAATEKASAVRFCGTIESMVEERYVPYQVILNSDPLSPIEDLATAIVEARQAQAFGEFVQCIKKGRQNHSLKESSSPKPSGGDNPICNCTGSV
jgi:hypothetical protein